MSMTKKFGMISLGCGKNPANQKRLLSFLTERGCIFTDDPAEAQAIVVDLCPFLDSVREETLGRILDCAGYKKDAIAGKIVVTKCSCENFTDTDAYRKICEVLENPDGSGKEETDGKGRIVYIGKSDPRDEEADERALYIRVLRQVVSERNASISMIQRKFGVRYNKAGKIIDWMEAMGYISAFDGTKPREVYMTQEDFERLYGSL